jgi:hypothetical protein
LSWVAQWAEAQDLQALVIMFRRVTVTRRSLGNLDSHWFFNDFLKRSLESGFPKVHEAAILLVDRFARVGWVHGFAYFFAYLPAILNNEQLRHKGLVMTVVLGAYAAAHELLLSVKVFTVLVQKEIFRGLGTRGDPRGRSMNHLAHRVNTSL